MGGPRRTRILVGLLALAVSVAGLVGGGAFQAPTRAQGTSVTLQAGGNNVVYAGDALPVTEALNDAAAGVTAVWSFDAPSQRWLLWNPVLPAPLQGFSRLEPGQAYWLEATSTTPWTFPTAGGVSSGPLGAVFLSTGFNNVAYGGSSEAIGEALGEIASLVTAIWAFDAGSQAWLLWSPALPDPLQGFTTLESGQAYWFVASGAGEWAPAATVGDPLVPPVLLAQAESTLADFFQTPPDVDSITSALESIVALFDDATAAGHDPATVLDAIYSAFPRALLAGGDIDAAVEALMALDQAMHAQAVEFNPTGLTVAAADEPFRRELSVYFINGVLNSESDGAGTANLLAILLGVPITHIYNWSFLNGSDYISVACLRAAVDRSIDSELVRAWCATLPDSTPLDEQIGLAAGAVQTSLQRLFDRDEISAAVNDKLVPMLQNDLLAGKAVIIIGHSQGTMFASNALDRVRRWWADQRDDNVVSGEPAIGTLYISPAFTTTESDTERYIRLPTDILGTTTVTGSEPTTMLEESQDPANTHWWTGAFPFPVFGQVAAGLIVHQVSVYMREGTASRREIQSDFAALRDFLTRDFDGGLTSEVKCTSGGFTWEVNLTQTFAKVRGTIAFHACPGGGRATYGVNGTAQLGGQIVELEGTKRIPAQGGLGLDVNSPRKQTFFFERGSEPDPNFVKSVDLAIFVSREPEPVLVDSNVTYTLEVVNRGPDRAENIEVTIKPRELLGTVVGSSVPCQPDPAGVLVCGLGLSLAKNASTTITVTYRAVFAGDFIIDVGVRSTTAGDTHDPDNTNTTSTEVIDPNE